jgi:hypothetical protein
MTPPKCRICGIREHNHRCQGGTPAQRIEERNRLMEGRHGGPLPAASFAATNAAGPSADPPPSSRSGEPANPTRRRWRDDTDAAGEPTEIREYERRPARFYAPPGQCVYCDRRREAARRSMAAVRERGTEA